MLRVVGDQAHRDHDIVEHGGDDQQGACRDRHSTPLRGAAGCDGCDRKDDHRGEEAGVEQPVRHRLAGFSILAAAPYTFIVR